MKRKTLSQYLREGATKMDALHLGPARGAYYERSPVVTAQIADPGIALWRGDPILMMFVGKFGDAILKSIGDEHRVEIYDERRVFDRPQVSERITKAVNGGLWELHRRLHEVPKLYERLRALGYSGERKFTSVFRAIVYMNDVAQLSVEEIAAALEEARL